MNEPFIVPDELALLQFFGAEPAASVPEDGTWRYDVTDAGGVTLRLSFDTLACSVQTRVEANGRSVALVVHEGAVKMWLDGEVLRCEFSGADSTTRLAVCITKSVSVEWSILRSST